jgi:hypothetical protein
MYLSIIIFPFLGSIFSGFLGRKVGIDGSQIISCLCLFFSAVFSTFALYETGLGASPVTINLGSWIDSEIMHISWEFLFDQLSVVFCIMITYITFLILVYTIYYMEGQPLSIVGSCYKGVKLSNSGKALKLTVPSNSRKAISGWSNYSEKVTSCYMSENEMGDRGSKSKSIINAKQWLYFVKEQRIEGSWFIKKMLSLFLAKDVAIHIFMNLRFILMGFERNYRIKYPSKQLNFSNYCDVSGFKEEKAKDQGFFWTGLTDAEGSFKVSMSKTDKRILGWRIEPNFEITLHIKDYELIEQFLVFLGGIGNIYLSNNRDIVTYIVSSKKDLEVLINNFNHFPLLSQKAADFFLFKKVVGLMNVKAHLTKEGLIKIINIKASMNLGLSEKLIAAANVALIFLQLKDQS